MSKLSLVNILMTWFFVNILNKPSLNPSKEKKPVWKKYLDEFDNFKFIPSETYIFNRFLMGF